MKGHLPPRSTTERLRDAEGVPAEFMVGPWVDDVVEAQGYGPRSMYVEMCWLPVLGPTATWLYRRLGSWAEHNQDGLKVDAVDLSVGLGLGEGLGRQSKLAAGLGRLVRFEVMRQTTYGYDVRTALPPLPQRLQGRLSYSGARYHETMSREVKPDWEGRL